MHDAAGPSKGGPSRARTNDSHRRWRGVSPARSSCPAACDAGVGLQPGSRPDRGRARAGGRRPAYHPSAARFHPVAAHRRGVLPRRDEGRGRALPARAALLLTQRIPGGHRTLPADADRVPARAPGRIGCGSPVGASGAPEADVQPRELRPRRRGHGSSAIAGFSASAARPRSRSSTRSPRMPGRRAPPTGSRPSARRWPRRCCPRSASRPRSRSQAARRSSRSCRR